MTTPSEPTTPTLEQRAATINDLCPEGWSVRPSGSSLAIVNPGAPDAPPAVIHADDAAIVATIWRWHTEALETKWTSAVALAPGLDGMRAAFQRAMPEGYGLMHATGSDNQTYWTWVRGAPAAGRSGEMLRPWDAVVSAWTASGGGGLAKLAEVIAEFSAGMFTPADFTTRAVGVDEALQNIREAKRRDREDAVLSATKREEVPAELAPFAAMALADIGHAAWLCGYHPGDDPRKVFARAAKQRLEWMEIEALLADDLKKARAVDPACTVESLVESIRDDARAFADKIGKMHAELERLRADVTPASRLAETAAERDEFWTTLRAIGLRDAESLEEFEARIAAEFEEAKQWRDNRADYEALREVQKARNDLRVYEMDASSLPMLASQAAALFDHLPESLEARSYDADRGASIAVRITRDPKRVRVETAPVSVDLRGADPEKLAAVLSTPTEPRLLNKPATKPERNVLDEVRGLGEATERFDRAAQVAGKMDVRPYSMPIGATNFVGGETLKIDVDGPVPVRAAGWTGITWMSGKGRAKSLTLPGLHVRADLGPDALRSAEMEGLSRKAIKVLQRRDRLYAFHLPGGGKRYGYVDTWGYLRAGEPLSISIRPPEVKPEAPKPARQGIAWRRPGHDVDSFAEVPIRPTFDEGGNQVIEVHAELPEDLQHEIKQTSRDRPTITVTTVNGATLKGPIGAWMRQNGPNGVLWRLTMPQRVVPLPT